MAYAALRSVASSISGGLLSGRFSKGRLWPVLGGCLGSFVPGHVECAHGNLRGRRLEPRCSSQRSACIAQSLVPAAQHRGAHKLIVLRRPLDGRRTVDQLDDVHPRLTGDTSQEFDFGFVLAGVRKFGEKRGYVPPKGVGVAECLDPHASAAGVANILLSLRYCVEARREFALDRKSV